MGKSGARRFVDTSEKAMFACTCVGQKCKLPWALMMPSSARCPVKAKLSVEGGLSRLGNLNSDHPKGIIIGGLLILFHYLE